MEHFLSHLVSDRKVSAATQKQVLNALVFLYHKVLDIRVDDKIAPVRSKRKQRSAHRIMREAIRDYVEKEEAKEQFAQEALASGNSYNRTGKHLTGAEVREWLQTWGTDNEVGISEYHK